MKKLKHKQTLLGAFMVLAIMSLCSFSVIEPKNTFNIATASILAASLPVKMMLGSKIPNKRFKTEDEKDNGSDKGEAAFLQKVKEKIEAAIVDYEAKRTKEVKDSAEYKELTEKIKKLLEEKANLSDSPVIKAWLKEHSDLILEVKKLKEQTGAEKVTMAVEIKTNKVALIALSKKTGDKEVVIKALVDRSDIDSNAQAFDLPDIGQLAHRRLSMYDIFPKLRIGASNNNGTVRYYDWDEATTVRAAAMVAEGAAFPESTAKWKTYTLDLKKVGDTIPVTEEMFEDEEMFAAELGMFLTTNVDLKIDEQLYSGDGTSNNLTGLKTSIDAYTLPAAGTVKDANIYDLLVKVSEAITSVGGSKYQPDFAVMNIVDINRMHLSKDENGNYLIPPFVSKDGNQVKSMIVIEANIVTANELVVGDRRFARIYEKAGVILSKGEINTQFTEDEMTLKARKRLLFLIRKADKGGFLKVADIDAAVAAINDGGGI